MAAIVGQFLNVTSMANVADFAAMNVVDAKNVIGADDPKTTEPRFSVTFELSAIATGPEKVAVPSPPSANSVPLTESDTEMAAFDVGDTNRVRPDSTDRAQDPETSDLTVTVEALIVGHASKVTDAAKTGSLLRTRVPAFLTWTYSDAAATIKHVTN